MEFKIHAKNLTLTDHQKEYIERKIEYLKKIAHRGHDQSAKATVEVEHVEHKDPSETIGMKINIIAPGKRFHADGFGSSVEETIDVLEDKLKHQIEHSKDDSGIHRT